MSLLCLFPHFYSVIWYCIEELSLSFWNKNSLPTGINWQHVRYRVGKYLELALWLFLVGIYCQQNYIWPWSLNTAANEESAVCLWKHLSWSAAQQAVQFADLLNSEYRTVGFFPPTSSWPVALTDNLSPVYTSNKCSLAVEKEVHKASAY